MSTERKIAEIREEITARVMKCTKLDLETLSLLLGIIEANRRIRRKNELGPTDSLLIDRMVLSFITLRAHDEDVSRMLSWCRAVMNNGVKRRAGGGIRRNA